MKLFFFILISRFIRFDSVSLMVTCFSVGDGILQPSKTKLKMSLHVFLNLFCCFVIFAEDGWGSSAVHETEAFGSGVMEEKLHTCFQ